MLRLYQLILVFCCSFSTHMVIGQKTTFTVKNYGLNDGLPSNRVFVIIQHSSGFIYVGTAQGLHRFNGRTFSPVKEVHGNELITEGTILKGYKTEPPHFTPTPFRRSRRLRSEMKGYMYILCCGVRMP